MSGILTFLSSLFSEKQKNLRDMDMPELILSQDYKDLYAFDNMDKKERCYLLDKKYGVATTTYKDKWSLYYAKDMMMLNMVDKKNRLPIFFEPFEKYDCFADEKFILKFLLYSHYEPSMPNVYVIEDVLTTERTGYHPYVCIMHDNKIYEGNKMHVERCMPDGGWVTSRSMFQEKTKEYDYDENISARLIRLSKDPRRKYMCELPEYASVEYLGKLSMKIAKYIKYPKPAPYIRSRDRLCDITIVTEN